ncbi:hypothetical protein ACP8H2_17125 [Bacillus subtilis]|uniref:hypothetical protein n=1 Tax=Bacillus subtilis TaxID=1423 RepID=UPI003CF6C2B7
MKPTITKEQADALYAQKLANYEEYILSAACRGDFEGTPLGALDVLTLAAALVNGYEVEKTPEEKVRELYNQHRHEAACSFTDEGTNLSLGKAFGIKEASKVFGVDVEGWDEFDNV